MLDLAQEARSATEKLLGFSDEELYEELGRRVQAMSTEPHVLATFDAQEFAPAKAFGVSEDLRSIARAYAERVLPGLHGVICGDDSSREAETIRKAVAQGVKALAAALATVIVSAVGLLPAVAAALAVLIVRIFGGAAYGVLCSKWSEWMSSAASNA